jgi:hypothetical protein
MCLTIRMTEDGSPNRHTAIHRSARLDYQRATYVNDTAGWSSQRTSRVTSGNPTRPPRDMRVSILGVKLPILARVHGRVTRLGEHPCRPSEGRLSGRDKAAKLEIE